MSVVAGGADRPTLAVNARFAARPTTGVERVARALVAHLPDALGETPVELHPGRRSSGAAGHLWEQTLLPTRFRRTRARVLLSPCNVGPVAVRSQLVLVHDVAPFRLPESFTAAYGAQVRTIQRALARRCALATVSEHSRRELAAVLGMDSASVAIVPPAVGAPFTDVAGDGRGGYCLFVGGHDGRKNLAFLLALWPAVHRRTGLELRVVARSGSATLHHRAGDAEVPGVRRHIDPSDRQLADHYRGALCVVSPSRYEGFGLPLLEGMACGTPFLSTDTGAAAELAIDPREQVLPLDGGLWLQRLVAWHDADQTRLRAASRAKALTRSWRHSAEALAQVVRDLTAPRLRPLATTAR